MLWWIGGSLAAVGTLAHGVLGEFALLTRLRDEGMPESRLADPHLCRLLLRAVWHLVTVDLGLASIGLFARSPEAARFVAAHFALYVVVGLIVVFACRRVDAFWRVPQLYLLTAIAACAWFAG